MGTKNYRQLLSLLLPALILAAAQYASAAPSGYSLYGLGLHQETGRDIYLGGLYGDEAVAPPQNLALLGAPRLMEYRIVARRTSIRSLLGGMLLQSEIATGDVASAATNEFADALLSQVRSSLYAGDSLTIELTRGKETVVALNGHELVRMENTEVADYILMGWLSESGPTAQFRGALTSSDIDPALNEKLANSNYSDARATEIAAWLDASKTKPTAKRAAVAEAQTVAKQEVLETPAATPQKPTVAQAKPSLQASTQNSPIAATVETPTPAAPTAGSAETIAALEQLSVDNDFSLAAKSPMLNLAPTAASLNLEQDSTVSGLEQIQTASLALDSASLGGIELDSEVLSLGVREYSQRLTEFHNGLVSMVYRSIKYPKRAIRRNLEGRLELDITMRKSGELVAVSIAESSGHSILDKAAVEAAEKAMQASGINELDAVAIAEFGNSDDRVVVPVPVNFQLMQ